MEPTETALGRDSEDDQRIDQKTTKPTTTGKNRSTHGSPEELSMDC